MVASNNQIELNLISISWGNYLNKLDTETNGEIIFEIKNVGQGNPVTLQILESGLLTSNFSYTENIDESLHVTFRIPSEDLKNLEHGKGYTLRASTSNDFNSFSITLNDPTFIVDTSIPSLAVTGNSLPWGDTLSLNDLNNNLFGVYAVNVTTNGVENNQIVTSKIIASDNSSSKVLNYTANVNNNNAFFTVSNNNLFELKDETMHKMIFNVSDLSGNPAAEVFKEFYVDFTNPIIYSVDRNWNNFINPNLEKFQPNVNVKTQGIRNSTEIKLRIIDNNTFEIVNNKTYISIINNSEANFVIPYNDIKNLENGKKYSLKVIVYDADLILEHSDTSNDFTIDLTPPEIDRIEYSWGTILSFDSVQQNGYIKVYTNGIQNGENLDLLLNNNVFSGIINDNLVDVLIPSENLKELNNGSNDYIINTQDAANNSIQKTYQLTVNTTPQEITIDSDEVVNNETSTHNEINLNIKFQNSPLNFSQNKILINQGQILSFNKVNDYLFKVLYKPENLGTCTFRIQSGIEDELFNTTTEDSEEFVWDYKQFSVLNTQKNIIYVNNNYKNYIVTDSKSNNLTFKSINQLPQWLKLNSNNGLLIGTPSPKDVSITDIIIEINDGNVSEILNFTLNTSYMPIEVKNEILKKNAILKKKSDSYSSYLNSRINKNIRKPNYGNINEKQYIRNRVSSLRRVGGGTPMKKGKM